MAIRVALTGEDNLIVHAERLDDTREGTIGGTTRWLGQCKVAVVVIPAVAHVMWARYRFWQVLGKMGSQRNGVLWGRRTRWCSDGV